MKFTIENFLRPALSEMDTEQVLKYLIDNNMINYTAVRNAALREYYHSLKYTDRTRAKMETAEVFCLSPEHVHQILYSRRLGKQNRYVGNALL